MRTPNAMNIALIGYGRMGRLIEEVARRRGHNICAIIDADNQQDFDSEGFKQADVAIEFSTPATVVANLERCLDRGVAVVCGATGWGADRERIERMFKERGGALLHSSNFSVGVNVMRAVTRYLSKIMQNLPQYSPSLVETHHIHKLDRPSGTAISLCEDVIASAPRVKGWQLDTDNPAADEIPVTALREGEVSGIHSLIWTSEADSITLTHDAKGREGFALGAVSAAEWLKGRKGVFTMEDVLQF